MTESLGDKITAGDSDSNPASMWLRVFFGLGACSWVPHWACHYYRLETGSSFIVGSWSFSQLDSVVSAGVYVILIAANLACIVMVPPRVWVALLSGLFHLAIGALHVARLFDPFRFEVFGHSWTTGASGRELLVVLPFGALKPT